MTIALVEIGTRAVRLLVANGDERGGIRIIDTAVQDSPLNVSSYRGPKNSISWRPLDELVIAVQRLLKAASRHSISDTLIYGTESLRRLTGVEVDVLRTHLPNLRILTAEEEARACHASACLVAHMLGRDVTTLISGDIGSGSFEMSAGHTSTPGRCSWYVGTDLGSNRLRELYIGGGLEEVARAVETRLIPRDFELRSQSNVLLAFSGSAATKFAWLLYKDRLGTRVRPDIRYDMKKIQGEMISGDELDKYVGLFDDLRNRDRTLIGQFVSPENPNGPEVEILISGMQVIVRAMAHTGCEQFMVNAYGSRHGIAWLKAGGIEF